jgi:hypothetical protein
MSKVQGVEDFLEAVRARPGMFVGEDYSLAALEHMLHGYSVALHAHGIEELGRDFNRRFSAFVYEKLDWSTSCGRADAIATNCVSAEAAFHRFFMLVDEFRQVPRKEAG